MSTGTLTATDSSSQRSMSGTMDSLTTQYPASPSNANTGSATDATKVTAALSHTPSKTSMHHKEADTLSPIEEGLPPTPISNNHTTQKSHSSHQHTSQDQKMKHPINHFPHQKLPSWNQRAIIPDQWQAFNKNLHFNKNHYQCTPPHTQLQLHLHHHQKSLLSTYYPWMSKVQASELE